MMPRHFTCLDAHTVMGILAYRKIWLKHLNCWIKLRSAHYSLALAHLIGKGASCHYLDLNEDLEKSIHHTLLAAIGGHEAARYALGWYEEQSDNIDRAMKHYLIAAGSGYDKSLKKVGEGYKDGHVSKDEYANTLRAYQVSVDEMKSEQRTKAKEM